MQETTEEKFLRLAVIEQVKYHEIAEKHDISLEECRTLWNTLKPTREKLAEILRVWKSKALKGEMDFYEFKNWHEALKQCEYCGITQEQLDALWDKNQTLTKRNRGRKFEIDRKEPNKAYTLDNIVCACYWCNNAKTDTFTEEEFKQIGQAIKNVWQKRLAE
ncbi:HNH endonuclease family protein [Rufibacter soli]